MAISRWMEQISSDPTRQSLQVHVGIVFALPKKMGHCPERKVGKVAEMGPRRIPDSSHPWCVGCWEAGSPSLGTGEMPLWDVSPPSCLSKLSSSPRSSIQGRWGRDRSLLLLAAAPDTKQQFCQVQDSSHLFLLFFLTVLIQQDFKHLLHPRVRGELNAQLCRQECMEHEGGNRDAIVLYHFKDTTDPQATDNLS